MHADTPTAMTRSLAEARYGSDVRTAFLTGIQAVARLPLDQRRLDVRASLDTAGFISGYRGSPLGGLDQELWRNSSQLEEHRIVFQPGINEDLAATAVWGTQQVGLFPGARHGGVFGMWYGKAPGLDRSTDAIRHANAAGTSPMGGVLAMVGDDHGCKSSTLPAASEYELRDLGVPVLAPADVQDVLDFGLAGWALSRYAGCWAGLIALTDIMDSALSVEVGLGRHQFVLPPHSEQPHIRLADSPLEQETRLETKLRLARAFASANQIDRIVAAPSRPRLVVVTAGKAYADVREAFDKLELRSGAAIADAGIRLIKLGMTWPLDDAWVREFCRGADRILVVEEKRAFIEEQLKAILFGDPVDVLGKLPRTGLDSQPMDSGLACGFPASGELDVPMIASTLATVLKRVPDTGYLGEVAVTSGALPDDAKNAKEARQPLYCAGCPHSTSTRVPQGSRAAAGIGCHYMAQWMDRSTATVTHMGAEGVNWIGQAPFTDEQHIFANLGDGTYFHSGILAIRAAVAAGVNITYKILLNDAVAMTGGQPVEGGLTVEDIVAQVRAEGVTEVRVVSDDPGRHRTSPVRVVSRRRLDVVQRELKDVPGCSVLVYEQTCAAELRRRRKRGLAPDPDVRVVINDAVCEGCGDCSVQSNCVAVEPLKTEFGTKRTINQSACNKDVSCLDGFCPALVTVSGARPKARAPVRDVRERLSDPDIEHESANILIAGVGGTGIVTVSQLLGTAAHLDGRHVSTLDMTGLAQKGGAVLSHVRISPAGAPHPPTRIPPVSVDVLIAADAVTAASRDVLPLASPQRTNVVLNSHVAPTAEFVLRQRDGVDLARLSDRLRHRARHMSTVDADFASRALFASTATANVFLLGYAYQTGAIPVTVAALERAISLNGVAVSDNLAAFHHGRLAAHLDANPQTEADEQLAMPVARSEVMQPQRSQTLAERIAARREFLVDYQNEALARRYDDMIERVRAGASRVRPTGDALVAAVAESYFKLLAVKDEYEVARLFSRRPAGVGLDFAAKLGDQFDAGFRTTFHFAPPFLAPRGANGRPRKIAVGGWFAPVLRLLARLRWLRGTALDPFRYTAERQLEKELVRTFEADVDTLVDSLDETNYESWVAIAKLPAGIRGFGPVKEVAARAAFAERARHLADVMAEPVVAPMANGHAGRTREEDAAKKRSSEGRRGDACRRPPKAARDGTSPSPTARRSEEGLAGVFERP
ncbi:MAG: indolepyruvate ferredoxin oxidoreductase family protein [Gammaproteobacteria bacterium]|nr:indolepyruvate ferredoxin oxidoreductase family protein [Gammaproteobacteria bacterium]